MEVVGRDKRGGRMVTGFEDKILICCECHEEFVFTSAAQEYFAERGYIGLQNHDEESSVYFRNIFVEELD